MVSATLTERAWAAGFIDGEGCFSCRELGRSLNLMFSVTQVDRRPLDRLIDILGSGKVRGPRCPPSHRGQPYHEVRLQGKSAQKLIDLVEPWLSDAKKEQIERCRQRIADYNERGTV